MQSTSFTDIYPQNHIYLVTGGTGSFGSAIVASYLADADGSRLRIYSRDEHKQDVMMSASPMMLPRLTYIIGDVRNSESLITAADGVNAIIHAAALKIVPQGERNQIEFVSTNITGTTNVVRAAIANRVPHSLFISSDKAVQPINHYGKTKAAAEGIWIGGNCLGVTRGSRFAVVRGGNVWGSRGSVLERWRQAKADNLPIAVNDPDTTRFYLPMREWVEFCKRALVEMSGGEIFVPKCRAWRLGDLAEAFGWATVQAGQRNGDKQNEIMISPDEMARTVDIGWAYIIEPSKDLRGVWNYRRRESEGVRLGNGFVYSSDGVERMSVEELRALI